MKNLIAHMRKSWDALDLKLVEPESLTNRDFAACVAVSRDPADYTLRAMLPPIVATFKETAQTEIMQLAQRRLRLEDMGSEYQKPYGYDMQAINRVLFRSDWFMTPVLIGHFEVPLMRALHSDGIRYAKDFPGYPARIGNLPFWILDHEAQASSSLHIQDLITQARDPNNEEARDQLRSEGLLRELPLGKVGLMFTGHYHCSSPVPEGGANSAFFFSMYTTPVKPNFMHEALALLRLLK